MPGDRTILRPAQPKFGINEIGYARISATKGYIEPLRIAQISFNVSQNQFEYSFHRNSIGDVRLTTDKPQLMPTTLLESEIIGLCDALDIQIQVLERQLTEITDKFDENCQQQQQIADPPVASTVKSITQPPRPRFGHGQVVYLRETAETTGRLEAFRIDGFTWDNNLGEWMYFFNIRPRPRRNTTVGDRDDLRRGSVITIPESQLGTICEALTLAVDFMDLAVRRAKSRRTSFCGDSTEGSS